MNTLVRRSATAVLAASALLTSGCGDAVGATSYFVAVNPDLIEVDVGATVKFTAQAFDFGTGKRVAGRTFTWRSEDPAIATVATDGQVTAVAAGGTRIFATESSTGSDGYGSIRVSAPAATPTRSSPAASN